MLRTKTLHYSDTPRGLRIEGRRGKKDKSMKTQRNADTERGSIVRPVGSQGTARETTTKADLFTPGEHLNRNPFAELPSCLGHPCVYLVMVLDQSGATTHIDSAWILQRLAEERIQQVQEEHAGLQCWVEIHVLNPEALKRRKK
jgi:hypothetical protein